MPDRLVPPLLVALAIALAVGGPIIAGLRRLKARQVISSDAPTSHQAKSGTPTMGGVIIVGAGVIAALALGPWTRELWAAVAVTLAFGAIGLVDDLLIVIRGKNLGLKARQKLALQTLFALAFVWWWDGRGGQDMGMHATLLASFHLLLLVGLSNAVNLTDGLDGLASGVAVPLFLLLGFIGSVGNAIEQHGVFGNHGLATFGTAMAGACLGFLWYNAHPAAVFMGDTGSLALGGAIAATGIMLRAEWPMLLAAGIYLAETVSVMIQVASFKTTGRRVFRMSPLHHHFELSGWPETRIVTRFWIIALALSALALYWLLS